MKTEKQIAQIEQYLSSHLELSDEQIDSFLSAYPDNVVKAWQTGDMQGMVTDTPLAQNYNELTEEAKQFIKEESEKMTKLMPFCKCGKQLNLTGVCGSCPKGNEGYKTKLICTCGYEEYFKDTFQEKITQLSGGN